MFPILKDIQSLSVLQEQNMKAFPWKLHNNILDVKLPVLGHYFSLDNDDVLRECWARKHGEGGQVSNAGAFWYSHTKKTPVGVETLRDCENWKCPEAVTLQTCSDDEACVYIICPVVSTSYLVAVQASPQAWLHFHLSACQQVIQSLTFYSDKSSEPVMHCTQYDSQRCLSTQPFRQQVEAVTGPRLAALTGTCLHRVRFGTAGSSTRQISSVPSREGTCADGSWTKGWTPVMSSGSF